MPTIGSILASARRALLAQQAAISTAGNNVANANTPGYARQRVDLTALDGLRTVAGQWGQGVDIASIQSLRDPIVEHQVRRGLAEQGWYDAEHQQLSIIESYLGGLEESGLTNALDKFWNSWSDLAADPASNAQRNVVRETAGGLIQQLHNIDRRLSEQDQQVADEIHQKLNRVNTLTGELAKLNGQLAGTGNGTATLDDRRAKILDELSTLTGAEYRQQEDNTVSVFIGGVNVVSRSEILSIRDGLDSEGQPLLCADSRGGSSPVTISYGEVGGLLNVRRDELNEMRGMLNDFAVSLVQEVNAVHRQGYGLDGATGRDFFDADTTNIHDIELDENILRNLDTIAASGDGLPGDNSNALNIAELQTRLNADGRSLSDILRSAVIWIGARTAEAEDLSEGAALALQQAQSWRDSVSGVSLDEELALIVEYQHAYNAAARIVSLADAMMETLLTYL